MIPVEKGLVTWDARDRGIRGRSGSAELPALLYLGRSLSRAARESWIEWNLDREALGEREAGERGPTDCEDADRRGVAGSRNVSVEAGSAGRHVGRRWAPERLPGVEGR